MKQLLVIACGASLMTSALAFDANSDFRKFAEGMLRKAENAFNTKNISFFEKSATADFTEKEMGRTVKRADALAEMKSMFSMAKSVNCKFKLLSTKASGNTGIIMTSGHCVMVMMPSKPKAKPSTMVVDMWEKETWVRDGKSWKIKMIEEAKPSKMTMDGKPYDPSKMGGH
jgi:hypothetical protein